MRDLLTITFEVALVAFTLGLLAILINGYAGLI
jgi:hypothetical protein